jgi:serine protease AprX
VDGNPQMAVHEWNNFEQNCDSGHSCFTRMGTGCLNMVLIGENEVITNKIKKAIQGGSVAALYCAMALTPMALPPMSLPPMSIDTPAANDFLAGHIWDSRDYSTTTPMHGADLKLAGHIWDTRASGESSPEPASNGLYIVQGNNTLAVRAAVEASGGQVSHQLDIINAVAARLTPSQQTQLRQHRSVVALHRDHGIQTSGKNSSSEAPDYAVKGAPELLLSGNTMTWDIANLGDKRLRISRIVLAWPEDNGSLVRLAVDGKTLHDSELAPAAAILEGNWGKKEGELRETSLHQMTLEFAANVDLSQQDYALKIEFEQDISVSFEYQDVLPYQTGDRETFYPALVGADDVQRSGYTGHGITVAVIDSGLWKNRDYLEHGTDRNKRILSYYDAIKDRTERKGVEDEYGHGTHVTSIIASSASAGEDTGSGELYNGIAPDANLVIVKAFDATGTGSYSDVIRAINYVLDHKDEFDIRVLNLSMAATPQSAYWADPLNQAVMAA